MSHGKPRQAAADLVDRTSTTIQSGNACNFNGTQSPDKFRFFLVQSGTLGLEQLTLANGCADGTGTSSARDGGAVYVQDGVLIAEEVTLRDNRARRGGAIFSAGSVLVEESTLTGNTATSGGALFATGTTTVSNSTLSGNVATSLGGAAYIEASATLNIEQSTLDTNTSGQLTGIYSSTSTVNLKNTILRNTRCAENFDLGPSTWNASGNSLDDGNTCANLFGANVTPNTNPLLGPLADNGGLSRTHALLPGSPAIDAAVSCTRLDGAAVLSDQRGIARPQGALCDIGAFESRGFTLTAASGSGQSTPVGSAFAAPLVVGVSSAFDEPVNGGRVSFAAPGSGASLGTTSSLVSIAGGQASLPITANATPGSYLVTADTLGSSAAVSFSLSNLPLALQVTAAVMQGEGSITPAAQTVSVGGAAGFTVTPAAGWAVASVSGDTCTPVPISSTGWQASNIQSDCAVSARFTTSSSATDLQIAKDSGVGTAMDGQVLVYTITVANAGPLAVSAAQLTDVLPATLVDAEWACLPAESSAACPPPPFDAGFGDLYAEIDLPVDSFLRYDLLARVQAADGTLVINTATVWPPSGVGELDPSNNSATDATLIVADGIFANGFEAGSKALTVEAAAKAQREGAGR